MSLFRVMGASHLVILLAAGNAQAIEDPACPIDSLPTGCLDNQTEYCTGFDSGLMFTKRAWTSRFIAENCEKVERMESTLRRNLDRLGVPENSEPSTICRRSGYSEGVRSYIDEVYKACDDQCWQRGQFWGETTAMDYCFLSIALEGLGEVSDFMRQPVLLRCSLNYETACDFEWDWVTETYSAGDEEKQQCIYYTQGDFKDVNINTREEMCAYEPIEPKEEQLLNEQDN